MAISSETRRAERIKKTDFEKKSGVEKDLTEKWKHSKKLCFPERFTPLEIPVVTTRNQAGHYF